MTQAFVADWLDIGRHEGSIDWLEPLLIHLHGADMAAELLHEGNGSLSD